MKKTKIARDAYENYREKRYFKLIIYWIILFASLTETPKFSEVTFHLTSFKVED